ncbi:MAG: class I SAM-dependent methyltransferase [bacterium]
MSNDQKYFETRLSYEPKRDVIWAVITKHLQRFIPPNAVILELGAGYCSFINHVEAQEKHALDKSAIIKNYADKSVKTHIRDCVQLNSFATASFDAIFSSFLFEHLSRSNLNSVLSQIRRILKPKGVLITLLPNFKYISRHYFDDYTHQQIFSHISFADYLVSKGFIIQHVQGRFLPFSFKSRLPQSPVLTRLYLLSPFKPFAGNMLVVATNPETITLAGKNGSQTEKSERPLKTSRKKQEGHQIKQASEKRLDTAKISHSGDITEKKPAHESVSDKHADQKPRTIRHGRQARRSASDHYGVTPSPGAQKIGRADSDDLPVTTETFETHEKDDKPSSTISPTDLRNRKRKKQSGAELPTSKENRQEHL